jgi:hypothetical protein
MASGTAPTDGTGLMVLSPVSPTRATTADDRAP